MPFVFNLPPVILCVGFTAGQFGTHGYGIRTVEDDIWKHVTNPGEYYIYYVRLMQYLIRRIARVFCSMSVHCLGFLLATRLKWIWNIVVFGVTTCLENLESQGI